MDLLIKSILEKYVDDSLVGVGALKGSPCTIKSKTSITGGTRVTFAWEDTEGVEHTQTVDIMNGEKGEKGDDGETPDMSSYYTKTEVDNALSTKANASNVYTKTETYTKTEVDNAISTAIGGALNGSY